jgi:hypothetical protein
VNKTVEFILAGGQDMPETIEEFETPWFRTLVNIFFPPLVRYKKAPVWGAVQLLFRCVLGYGGRGYQGVNL